MKKDKIKQFNEHRVKIGKLRNRIALRFFLIVVVFMIALFLVIHTAKKMGVKVEYLKNPSSAIVVVALFCLVLSSVASYYMMRAIFIPLEQISEASKQVAKGDFSVQLTYNGDLEELENTIQNFNKMAKELNSVEIMRNDFIADVSHEFKTPLSAISGYATFLQDSDLSEEERNEYIKKIFFNIEKINDLTTNILYLSKLEHQQFMEEPASFRLDEQIREAIVLLEPKWSKKKLEFELDLPETLYCGYRTLLFQVWTNMIGNAIKYTDAGGMIEVYLKTQNSSVQVIISDNGIGMSEETQKHIFDKFYQGDTARRSEGNGLGLALCKEIIERCSGEIHVESKPGVGTVFIVSLPVL